MLSLDPIVKALSHIVTKILAEMEEVAWTTTMVITLVIVPLDGLVRIANNWSIGAENRLAKTERGVFKGVLLTNAIVKPDGLEKCAMSDKYLAKLLPCSEA